MNKGFAMPKSAAADAAVAASAAVAGATWVTKLNDLLQLGLTVASIVGVIYAIAWHRMRIKEMKRKVEELHEEVASDE